MRLLLFMTTILAPSAAFACGWKYIDSPPADYIWSAPLAACIVAIVYQLSASEKKSWAPEALAVACIVFGFGLGAFFGVGEWDFLTASLATAPVVIPYLAMKTQRRAVTIVLLVLFSLFPALLTFGAFNGKKVSAFSNVNDDVVTDVTF